MQMPSRWKVCRLNSFKNSVLKILDDTRFGLLARKTLLGPNRRDFVTVAKTWGGPPLSNSGEHGQCGHVPRSNYN